VPSFRSTFQCAIQKGTLAAAADVGPTFSQYSIIVEHVLHHTEIDRDDDVSCLHLESPVVPDPEDAASVTEEEGGSESESNREFASVTLPPPGLLQGYEYAAFKPNDRSLAGHIYIAPTQYEVKAALNDLALIIRPKRKTGPGYKDPDLDLWTRTRLEGMQSTFRMYTDPNSRTYGNWAASSLQAAVGMGRGPRCARCLRELCRGYLDNRKVLPVNPFGDWNESLLLDENLCNEINIFLLSIGNEISAKRLMDFLHQPDIKEKYGIQRNISIRTARRYLNALGYRYRATPKGQYVDGHERADVVFYRNTQFLPRWCRIWECMARWDENLTEIAPPGSGRRVVTWFHDESVFYAHDRRRKSWYHKDAPAKPYAKGEGASLMVADYVSQDFGWLASPDGKRSARRLFKPGKNWDGYFTNEDVREQANEAMDILLEYYPQFDHVFIYNNTTTHLKRADDALSARAMPKNIPKPGSNWGVQVTNRDQISGKPICNPDGSHQKIKIRMGDARLANGEPQCLYFPPGHPREGVFKGMAVILQEQGFGDMSKVRTQCKDFKCQPGATNCCCRRILYNEPDFMYVDSLLEILCRSRGFQVMFLPKFHCELNFIEQCWGRAKSVYRTYPESSREDQLEANMLMALESIPLPMMQKFANRSLRFMDAYCRGLNGKQVAWASRKYRGHRVLPESILEELGRAGIV